MRTSLIAGMILVLSSIAVFGQQDQYDTIYKFPDRKGKNTKVIRGIVETETKDTVVYKVGLDQRKTIPAEMVIKVEYRLPGNRIGDQLRDDFLKAVAEFENGNYEDAKFILERIQTQFKQNPRLSKWIGAYSQFYLGQAYLHMGMKMEKSGLLEALFQKRYAKAVAEFKKFKEAYPNHRLQFDLPVPYATALIKSGKGNLDAALALLDGVQARERNQHAQLRKFKALKLKGDILTEAGRHDDALSVYSELLRIVPKEKAIDEIVQISQDLRVFVGMVILQKGEETQLDPHFKDAEDYFKQILADVSGQGIVVPNLGKVYLSIGRCRAHFKDWERAQWYFLHGAIGYFDDPEVHKQCLFWTIKSLDQLIPNTTDPKKKKEYIRSIREHFDQLSKSHGPSTERMQAKDIVKKYKNVTIDDGEDG